VQHGERYTFSRKAKQTGAHTLQKVRAQVVPCFQEAMRRLRLRRFKEAEVIQLVKAVKNEGLKKSFKPYE